MFESFLEPIDLYFAQLHAPCTVDVQALLAAVMHASRQGHLCLDLDNLQGSDEWIHTLKQGASQQWTSPYIVSDHNLLYLEKNYRAETEVILELKKRISTLPLPPANPLLYRDRGGSMTPEQKDAFNLVRSQQTSIIEGGPGTGKTYLVQELARSLGPQGRVILTAPTGKAVGRLKENTLNGISGTLHSILGIQSSKNIAQHRGYIEADLIVVDEASMIDVNLWRVLLKSVGPHQRIVFLGDCHQLPPIESGAIFNDLVDLIPTAHLKTCHRSDRKEVLEWAHSILEGKMITPHAPLSYSLIRELVETKGAVILTPLKEGPWGVKVLNEKMAGVSKEPPIIITKNNPQLSVYNGDRGCIISPLQAVVEGKIFSLSELPPYELAYALSIHKSQGSEFDHVVVLVPPGTEIFGRELLYTAVTRARESVTVLGDIAEIAKTLRSPQKRSSGIQKRWNVLIDALAL